MKLKDRRYFEWICGRWVNSATRWERRVDRKAKSFTERTSEGKEIVIHRPVEAGAEHFISARFTRNSGAA